MAFRRTRRPTRRFRRKWDMQTFRDCERQVDVAILEDSFLTCGAPQTIADYVCGLGTSTGLQMKTGASRSLTFGGGHLRIRLNSAVYDDSEMPCGFPVKVVLALCVLPTKEDEITPAYLPNLAVARSQLSVVVSTQSDSDENIVWWYDEQLDLTNLACTFDNGGDCPILSGCHFPAGSDTPTSGLYLFTHTGALYGRFTVDMHVKAKRRLQERQALYLIQHYVTGANFASPRENWKVRRNVYFRYAVR